MNHLFALDKLPKYWNAVLLFTVLQPVVWNHDTYFYICAAFAGLFFLLCVAGLIYQLVHNGKESIGKEREFGKQEIGLRILLLIANAIIVLSTGASYDFLYLTGSLVGLDVIDVVINRCHPRAADKSQRPAASR